MQAPRVYRDLAFRQGCLYIPHAHYHWLIINHHLPKLDNLVRWRNLLKLVPMSYHLHHHANMSFQDSQFLKQYAPNRKYLRRMLMKQPPTIPIHRQTALHWWKEGFKVELMKVPLYHFHVLGIELSYHKPLSQEKEQSRRSMPMKYVTIHTLQPTWLRNILNVDSWGSIKD